MGFGRKLKEFFVGKKPTQRKIKTMTPAQTKAQSKVLDAIIRELERKPEAIDVPEIPGMEEVMPGGFPQIQQPEFSPLPEFDFAARKAQAEQEFMQRDIPELAERFASMGKGVAASPAFTSALSRAKAGLRSQLAALEEQMGQEYGLKRGDVEARQQAIGLTGQRLGSETEWELGNFV